MTRSWDRTWMDVAQAVSQRSHCTRDQVGAVIVSASNRIVAVGYNGPPAGYGDDVRCMRELDPDNPKFVCHAIHAEANALMFNDRRDREGGTIYATSTMCYACALLVANSGLARVVAPYRPQDHPNRHPIGAVNALEQAGLEFLPWVHG